MPSGGDSPGLGPRFGATTAPVLLVDDDVLLRDALVVDLEALGLRVLTAANGEDALTLARELPRPSLILLDLNMPVMDGCTFRAHQMRDPKLADVPVILLSACGDADRQGRALGVAAALSKPVDLDKLHDVMARHCRA